MDGKVNLRALGEESLLQFFPSPDAQRIVDIARDDRASKRSFTEVIGANPLLAARLLRLANFAPGLPLGLSTLSQALSLFGQDHLKPLALGLALFDLCADPGMASASSVEEAPIRLEELWDHALGSAVIAGVIAEKIPEAAPVQAFTAGFIHDIGRVLLLQRAREQLLGAAVAAADKHIPLIQAELLTLGTDLDMIGAKSQQLRLNQRNMLVRSGNVRREPDHSYRASGRFFSRAAWHRQRRRPGRIAHGLVAESGVRRDRVA